MFEHRHHPKEKGAHRHHAHDGHHHHHDFRTVEKKRLRIVIVLTLVMMVVELVWGFLSNSLALLSDAFHMLTHFGALAVSLISIIIATRLKSRDKTFGYWRVEILSALFNGITLLPIMAYILYEAYHRFRHPEAVVVSQMLVVASLGLVVNLVCAAILADVSRDDFNLRGAFLHLIGDTASSGGVVLAAIIIHYTNWTILDPLVSVLIALVILVWSVGLIRESVNILLESVPRGIKLKEVKQAVMEIEAVREIHDVHIWQITSKMYAMTAHVGIENVPIQETKEILEHIHHVLDSRFHISHVNIQFEPYNGNGDSEA
ncbi:MAG: cation diffusion facilitator family transporter [bacterium]|nr:cation diffusion facilitator family transporter [bacterium]